MTVEAGAKDVIVGGGGRLVVGGAAATEAGGAGELAGISFETAKDGNGNKLDPTPLSFKTGADSEATGRHVTNALVS